MRPMGGRLCVVCSGSDTNGQVSNMRGIGSTGAALVGVLASILAVIVFLLIQWDPIEHKLEIRGVVGRYYEALEDENFRAAYDYYHPAVSGKDGAQGPFRKWKKVKENDQVEAIHLYHVETANIQGGKLPEVIVEMQTRDKSGVQCFDGKWTLKQQGMYWKLYSWDTRRTPLQDCDLTRIEKLKAWVNETLWQLRT
jgi:hypothetical protein